MSYSNTLNFEYLVKLPQKKKIELKIIFYLLS